MESGSYVWIKRKDDWKRCIVIDQTAQTITCIHSDQDEKFIVPTTDDRIALCNPDVPETQVDDLTSLTHLHEPGILHCLQLRFHRDNVYTFSGPILLAINPFQKLDLYSDELKLQYVRAGFQKHMPVQARETKGTPLAPHVYSIADNAFHAMMNKDPAAMEATTQDQTILVSGESGAGKTETTKILMDYLATIAQYQKSKMEIESNPNDAYDAPFCGAEDDVRRTTRVLQSNPLLEAFGNAQTVRNGNSSRFGKFMRIGFSGSGQLLGAKIQTYLLELVRVIGHEQGERNYHIFYQLLGGMDRELASKLCLSSDIAQYDYLVPSGKTPLSSASEDSTPKRLEEDRVNFHLTCQAMGNQGISAERQLSLWQILAAILHLGNLSFEQQDHGVRIPSTKSVAVQVIADFLQLSVDKLTQLLTTRRLKAGVDDVIVPLNLKEAVNARDGLSKTLYSQLFEWLVSCLNRVLDLPEAKVKGSIGVMDIFGFEIFERNGFEQFCINYANEKLQQLFNQSVFENDQQEYAQEKIEWQRIQAPSNRECVAVFESKPVGLFALLDEQCRVPGGSDQQLFTRIQSCVSQTSIISIQKQHTVKQEFHIRHYAGQVKYSTQGFIDKNKDRLNRDISTLFQSSRNSFLAQVFSITLAPPEVASPKSKRRQKPSSSVVWDFQKQLAHLLERISETELHFIRCFKPNDKAICKSYDRHRMLAQLHCSGIVEAVEISREGYPIRYLHEHFLHRYRNLIPSHLLAQKSRKRSVQSIGESLDTNTREKEQYHYVMLMLNYFLQTSSMQSPCTSSDDDNINSRYVHPFQIGLTKVFMSANLHLELENRRYRVLNHASRIIQRCLQRFNRLRKEFARDNAVQRLQSFWRVICAKTYRRRCREKAILIQTIVRMRLAKKQLELRKKAMQEQKHMELLRAQEKVLRQMEEEERRREQEKLELQRQKEQQSAQEEERKRAEKELEDKRLKEGNLRKEEQLQVSKKVHPNPIANSATPPAATCSTYIIEWGSDLLGLYFEPDPVSGLPIVHRVHQDLSSCTDISRVRPGDALFSVGTTKLTNLDFKAILTLLQETPKPVDLQFQRGELPAHNRLETVLPALSTNEFEVLWKDSVPLGLGFKYMSYLQMPYVSRHTGNPTLPGMDKVRLGDVLTYINDQCTHGVEFRETIAMLENGARPMVLRFRRVNPAEDGHGNENDMNDENARYTYHPKFEEERLSEMSFNPKIDGALYEVVWKDGDGPLGIVVKQGVTSYYPTVTRIKDDQEIAEGIRGKVVVGDVLLSINDKNINKMGFRSAMRLLQRGPKPMVLMFQRCT